MMMLSSRRRFFVLLLLFSIFLILLTFQVNPSDIRSQLPSLHRDPAPDGPRYKPAPTYTPPPVVDPFPALATSKPPPIPSWNVPAPDLHNTTFGLPLAPPLLIGFTRSWPTLLQAVVSYLTAGWPAEQLFVVENTGAGGANARGRLTLQNPFYLDHERLAKLGVAVIATPTLLTFAQLQNFYIATARARGWPYFLWSHMDVVALSAEDGLAGISPPAASGAAAYKPLYHRACEVTAQVMRESPERWAGNFFAYDYLMLVNPTAFEAVGAWDSYIPYYLTDCDIYQRLGMAGWKFTTYEAGAIADINTVLDDLRVLYRDKSVKPSWRDPNPPPERRAASGAARSAAGAHNNTTDASGSGSQDIEYFRALVRTVEEMGKYKTSERWRNTWREGQRGGFNEEYYYDPLGFAEAFDVINEAGREVYRRKWGTDSCDLHGKHRELWDQWRVLRD